MPDSIVTIDALKRAVAGFADERDWSQYHSLKNLAMSISIEAGELMECFQWADSPESNRIVDSRKGRQRVEEELADVVIYALQFASQADIDLSEAVTRKMAVNAQRYPVGKAKGRSEKYDAL